VVAGEVLGQLVDDLRDVVLCTSGGALGAPSNCPTSSTLLLEEGSAATGGAEPTSPPLLYTLVVDLVDSRDGVTGQVEARPAAVAKPGVTTA
jgi:hypothetical protein